MSLNFKNEPVDLGSQSQGKLSKHVQVEEEKKAPQNENLRERSGPKFRNVSINIDKGFKFSLARQKKRFRKERSESSDQEEMPERLKVVASDKFKRRGDSHTPIQIR